MIAPGEPAPDFTLRDQDGKKTSLADFEGRTVVLVFYPNDFSPVCTDQLNVYQEVAGALDERGVSLVGISIDSTFVHKAFREHLGITIPLLADFHPKGEVARAYGVFNEKYGVSERALVMVDPGRTVTWSYVPDSPLQIPGANLIFDALDQQHAA